MDEIDWMIMQACMKHMHYNDPENPEISAEINKELDKIKEKYADAEPPAWITGYVKEVTLGGEPVLPYICEKEIESR